MDLFLSIQDFIVVFEHNLQLVIVLFSLVQCVYLYATRTATHDQQEYVLIMTTLSPAQFLLQVAGENEGQGYSGDKVA